MHVKLAGRRGKSCREKDVHGWLCGRKNQPRRGSLQGGKISKVKTKRTLVFDPPPPLPVQTQIKTSSSTSF